MLAWLAVICQVLGIILIGQKRMSCWPLFLLGASCWVLVAITDRNLPLLALNSFLVVLNIYNWTVWRRDVLNARKASPEAVIIARK